MQRGDFASMPVTFRIEPRRARSKIVRGRLLGRGSTVLRASARGYRRAPRRCCRRSRSWRSCFRCGRRRTCAPASGRRCWCSQQRYHKHSDFIRRMPSMSSVKGGLQLGAGAAELGAVRDSGDVAARGTDARDVDFERLSVKRTSMSLSKSTTLVSVSKPLSVARIV